MNNGDVDEVFTYAYRHWKLRRKCNTTFASDLLCVKVIRLSTKSRISIRMSRNFCLLS